MKVEDADARNFHVEECAKSNWSTRQLERQINSFYFQRLLSSRNKDDVSAEITKLEPGKRPEDIIHNPYVLEFLGFEQSDDFYESDLEQALIGQLQNFLLELGRGFSFVARQKHINWGGEHFYIDLVFYNYILKCFVLIDLKTGKLTHQDIGQMAVQEKLVPQDPNDEPASVLLERIRAEKEAMVKAGTIKKEKNPSVIFRGADLLIRQMISSRE